MPTKILRILPDFICKNNRFSACFWFWADAYSCHIWRARCNGSYTMMAKPIRALELHYPMTQFLIMMPIIFSKDTWLVHCGYVWIHFTLYQSYPHYRQQNFPEDFIAYLWYLTSKVVRENSQYFAKPPRISPQKWRLRNACRNSILKTGHYPDQRNASYCLCCDRNLL